MGIWSAQRGVPTRRMHEYGESLRGLKVVRQIAVTTGCIILLEQDFFLGIGLVLEVGHRRGSGSGVVVRKVRDSA